VLGILLVGFERFEFLHQNLDLVEKLKGSRFTLYVSIDGPKKSSENYGNSSQELSGLIKKASELGSTNFVHNQNMGCDMHIPWAIGKVLQECESIIVIEDDVRISCDGLIVMMQKLLEKDDRDYPKVILGMSSLFNPIENLSINIWRSTRFFTAWGYGLNREFWKLHTNSTLGMTTEPELKNLLSKSRYWWKLSTRKKKIWSERFQRGNYDYKIQATMFQYNLRALAPVFRIVDNIGHGLEGATHTRFREPIYLRYRVSAKKFRFLTRPLMGNFWNAFFDVLDSNSWAGEGLLTLRGRRIGIRTLISIIIKRQK
jgi:hypothetical protein